MTQVGEKQLKERETKNSDFRADTETQRHTRDTETQRHRQRDTPGTSGWNRN